MHNHSCKITMGYLSWFFLISFIIMFTAPKAAYPSTLRRLKKGKYDEDLVVYRTKFYRWPNLVKLVKKEVFIPLVCPMDQVQRLAQRLAQRKTAYERTNCVKGYTIQLYMGSSRAAALQTQDLVNTFPYPSKLHYRQPNYTVQLGFFPDRLEAYLVYLTLVKKVSGIMIRPFLCTRKDYLETDFHSNNFFLH